MVLKEWVKVRANCTPKNIFMELKKKLASDVDIFNKLPEQSRGKRKFKYTDEDNIFRVFRAHLVLCGNGESVLKIHPDFKDDLDHIIELKLDQDKFIAKRGQLLEVQISYVWNPESLACDYFVNEKVVDLSWISQHILGDFLFEELLVN